MNWTQLKCLFVLILFIIVGFGPISPLCLIGLYLVIMRPPWFLTLAHRLYAGRPLPPRSLPTMWSAARIGLLRIECFFGLLALFVVDIVPFPVTPVLAGFIVLSRPIWFYRLVIGVYG
ncbi:MAG: hypothetical protein PHW13_01055 [Methylococcales bacterium]|nr:hypothetical protein [Methylococcales bacterium]